MHFVRDVTCVQADEPQGLEARECVIFFLPRALCDNRRHRSWFLLRSGFHCVSDSVAVDASIGWACRMFDLDPWRTHPYQRCECALARSRDPSAIRSLQHAGTAGHPGVLDCLPNLFSSCSLIAGGILPRGLARWSSIPAGCGVGIGALL